MFESRFLLQNIISIIAKDADSKTLNKPMPQKKRGVTEPPVSVIGNITHVTMSTDN
jgi:hypothetical protein